jgi:hypothetical protein
LHIMRDLVIFTLYQICLVIKSVRLKWAGSSRHGRDEKCIGKSEGNTPGLDQRMMWNGFRWLWIAFMAEFFWPR